MTSEQNKPIAISEQLIEITTGELQDEFTANFDLKNNSEYIFETRTKDESIHILLGYTKHHLKKKILFLVTKNSAEETLDSLLLGGELWLVGRPNIKIEKTRIVTLIDSVYIPIMPTSTDENALYELSSDHVSCCDTTKYFIHDSGKIELLRFDKDGEIIGHEIKGDLIIGH